MTSSVDRRVVVHFPGFERMDTHAHHSRFKRTAHQSAKLWDFSAEVGPLRNAESASDFAVVCKGPNWQTSSRIYVCDHNALVEKLTERPVLQRITSGFFSAARVVLQGGLVAYFRHAWRFGLFFLFPFFLMGLALATSLALAALPGWLGLLPWHYLWSMPLAWAFFHAVFLPFSERFHTLHLFADWELAVAVANTGNPILMDWLEDCFDTVLKALDEDADEYIISSHSMGSSLATHVLGMVLERNPHALAGRRVVFATFGGAILQCALLRSAARLRHRVGIIARAQEVFWLEVQCLTDVIHFYKSRVVALSGHPDAPQAGLLTIRVKHLLSPERYQKIRRDLLRVHRQYVLHADLRGPFDFTLLTAGPFPAQSFSDFSKLDFDRLSTRKPMVPLNE